jgi:hypothetical protein
MIETLLTLLLFVVVLIVIADLTNGFRNLIRHSEGRSRTIRALRVAVSQIRSDLGAATAVLQPSGGSSDALEVQRLQPALSPRLPATVPSTVPKSWNILDPTHLYSIRYNLIEEDLVREVNGQSVRLMTGLRAFEVDSEPANQYTVRLTVKERARDVVITTKVTRP